MGRKVGFFLTILFVVAISIIMVQQITAQSPVSSDEQNQVAPPPIHTPPPAPTAR